MEEHTTDTIPVTGQSVFWALLAVALTATTQRSYTAEKVDTPLMISEQPLTAYRISPIVCVVDTLHEICDIYRLLKKTRTPTAGLPSNAAQQSTHATTAASEESQGADISSDTTTICMKVALFVLGALPQVIKLFAYQGIPCSQTLAGIYLAAIIVHAIHFIVNTAKNDAKHEMLFIATEEIIRDAAVILHCVLYAFVCPHISVNILRWLAARHGVAANIIKLLRASMALVSVSFLAVTLILSMILLPRDPPRWLCFTAQATFAISTLVLQPTNSVNPSEQAEALFPIFSGDFKQGLSALSQLYTVFVPCVLAPALVWLLVSAALFWATDRLVSGGSQHLEQTPSPVLLEDAVENTEAERKTAAAAWRSIRQNPIGYILLLLPAVGNTIERTLTPFAITDAVLKWMSGFRPSVRWTAFLLMNVMTAAQYYTIVFDGTNTVNPGWTGVFG